MNTKTLYGQYKYLYRKERKQFNIKRDMHQLTYKQFKMVIAEPETDSIKKILDAQRLIKQEDKAKRWREYKKLLKNKDNTALKPHKTFKAFMRDRATFASIIAERIRNGEDRKSVLADYGYIA